MNLAWRFGHLLLCMNVLLGITSCSIIAEYPLYLAKGTDSVVMTKEPAQPSLYIEGARAGSKRFYGSHALSTDDVCVLVYETNISAFRTLFWGPFTCPCFPILFFNDLPERPEAFHLAVVFVTRHKEHAFSFDPRKVTIRHPNGTVSTPQTTIGGRARMKWEESCPLLRPCRSLEQLVDSEGFINVEGSYELWDWTPFVVTFPKQQQTLFPIHVSLEGMSRSGDEYKLPEFDLIEGRGRIAYVYPIENPKAKTLWVSPQGCRSSWPGISSAS